MFNVFWSRGIFDYFFSTNVYLNSWGQVEGDVSPLDFAREGGGNAFRPPEFHKIRYINF